MNELKISGWCDSNDCTRDCKMAVVAVKVETLNFSGIFI